MTRISYITPSINRETLHRTISSIEAQSGDEILVEYDIPRTFRWGNDQRNKAMARATGDYLAFIDDDDFYVPGHRAMQEQAILENPGKLIMFQMQYPDTGRILWETPEIKAGNVSTPQILIPNDKAKLHYWEGARNMADFLFVRGWQGETVWIDKVLVQLGHADGEARHHD